MDRLHQLDQISDWTPPPNAEAAAALECGKVVFFPSLTFAINASEARYIDPAISDGKSKNVSFDPHTGRAKGTSLSGADVVAVEAMMARYHAQARSLIAAIFPGYARDLISGRTSFRPVAIDDRPTSWRKDDRRLHVDAFPSQPVGNLRILRVFTNVDPSGRTRDWLIGEDFRDVARRFAPAYSALFPGLSWALHSLGLTKARRTRYDAAMLHLHDSMKRDLGYQSEVPRQAVAFPAQSSWIVFTDIVSHAATGGQHVFEQTFYLPCEAMNDPGRSPQRILADQEIRAA